MSPIKEVILIKKNFNWSFYKNDELIEEYKNLKIIDNTYQVNENLKLIKEDNCYKLERLNDDYKVTIDFKNKTCTIELLQENESLNEEFDMNTINDFLKYYDIMPEDEFNNIL